MIILVKGWKGLTGVLKIEIRIEGMIKLVWGWKGLIRVLKIEVPIDDIGIVDVCKGLGVGGWKWRLAGEAAASLQPAREVVWPSPRLPEGVREAPPNAWRVVGCLTRKCDFIIVVT